MKEVDKYVLIKEVTKNTKLSVKILNLQNSVEYNKIHKT